MSIANPNFCVSIEIPDEQEEVEAQAMWDAWYAGFHAYMDGGPQPEEPSARRGWQAARGSEWTLDCPAAVLNKMGV